MESTWSGDVQAAEERIGAGPVSFGIRPGPLSLVTSLHRSPGPFAFCMYSWRWRSARGGSCTAMSRLMPLPSGPLQQFREVLADLHPYRFVIHDHDSFFSSYIDLALGDFGVRVLRTPIQAPTANAYCERLIGTIRRECLDYVIPINERHLRLTLKEFAAYYNRARPHSALGPNTSEQIGMSLPDSGHRHRHPTGYQVRSKSVLGACITITDWKRRQRRWTKVFAEHNDRRGSF